MESSAPLSSNNNNNSVRSSSSDQGSRRNSLSPNLIPYQPYNNPFFLQSLHQQQQLANSSSLNSQLSSSCSSSGNNNNNKRTRHRVDAGEPRGCFQQSYYSFYDNKMLDYNQQLLRDMLVKKIGFEEDVKINGCKKRKLYQPIKNGTEAREDAVTLMSSQSSPFRVTSPTPPPLSNGWGSNSKTNSPSPRIHHLHPTPSSPPPPPIHPPFINQWKESFKTNMLATISELIDAQFSSLLTSQQQAVKVPTIFPTSLPNITKAPQSVLPNLAGLNPIVQPTPTRHSNFYSGLSSAGLNLRREDLGQNNNLSYPPPTDSPLSLVMTPSKKKRHKVTDTRLTPRAVSKLLEDDDKFYFGKSSYDSSPPASLNEFVQSQLDGHESESGGSDGTLANSSGGTGEGGSNVNSWNGNGECSSTLTPMHLRKAKLMFFWVRYPSSSVLKMYFPDIKFNKNNTAQLVKWFSNFREFYYIQMEKYARTALAEGVKSSDDIHITIDTELYRVLNLHYNRNNHIEVPTNFRYVVEQTLREFFKAVQNGKDSEQSWKKTIYKIIARLDDPVPEYFKQPNFLEQLE